MIKRNRFWEIDFLRGFAVILMIIFHLFFDLKYFLNLNFGSLNYLYILLGKITFFLFFLLVGISLRLSYLKKKNFNYYFKRGLFIFSLGLVISLITYFIIPSSFIKFGALHFIGFSIILAFIFLRFKYLNLLFGMIFLFFGLFLKSKVFDFNCLFFLGFKGVGFNSVDYFPIFPYFSLVLFGIFLGNFFYLSSLKRNFKLIDLSNNFFISKICFLGKKSLLIYFLHQPIIFLFLFLFGVF